MQLVSGQSQVRSVDDSPGSDTDAVAVGASLLSVENLCVSFDAVGHEIKAVEDVSFCLSAGEVLAIVGESGSGKSVTGLAILGLIQSPPGRIKSGQVRLHGQDLLRADETHMQSVRGRRIGMIFQNPRGSLNPAFTVETHMIEVLSRHRPDLGKAQARKHALAMLRTMGFQQPERIASSKPHQISGGMCQRVAIALAMLCEPDLLIADEPTTALDVVVQATILNVLKQAHRERRLPIILITHDFGVVRAMATRVVVMYAGHIQEEGTVNEILTRPQHPYTQALIASVPNPRQRGRYLKHIEGQPPDLGAVPAGCRFAPRCAHAADRCHAQTPELRELSDGRRMRCHFDPAQLGVQ